MTVIFTRIWITGNVRNDGDVEDDVCKDLAEPLEDCGQKLVTIRQVVSKGIKKILRKCDIYHKIWNSIGHKMLISEDKGASYPRFARFLCINIA